MGVTVAVKGGITVWILDSCHGVKLRITSDRFGVGGDGGRQNRTFPDGFFKHGEHGAHGGAERQGPRGPRLLKAKGRREFFHMLFWLF